MKHLFCARHAINACVQELPEGSEVGRKGFLEEKTPWDLMQASEVDGFEGHTDGMWPL